MLPGNFSQIHDLPLNLCLRSAAEEIPTRRGKTLLELHGTTRYFFTSVAPAEPLWNKAGDAQLHSPCPSADRCHLSHTSRVLEGVLLCSIDPEELLGLAPYCEHRPVVITALGPRSKVIQLLPARPSPARRILACVLTGSGFSGEHPCLVSLFFWGLHIAGSIHRG